MNKRYEVIIRLFHFFIFQLIGWNDQKINIRMKFHEVLFFTVCQLSKDDNRSPRETTRYTFSYCIILIFLYFFSDYLLPTSYYSTIFSHIPHSSFLIPILPIYNRLLTTDSFHLPLISRLFLFPPFSLVMSTLSRG